MTEYHNHTGDCPLVIKPGPTNIRLLEIILPSIKKACMLNVQREWAFEAMFKAFIQGWISLISWIGLFLCRIITLFLFSSLRNNRVRLTVADISCRLKIMLICILVLLGFRVQKGHNRHKNCQDQNFQRMIPKNEHTIQNTYLWINKKNLNCVFIFIFILHFCRLGHYR